MCSPGACAFLLRQMTGMSKDSKPPGSSGVEVSIDTMTQAAATRKPARGSLALRNAFVAGEERGRAAFISYFLAGYPAPEDTVDILLAMERGGTDVIEYTLSLTPIHSLRHRLVRSRQYA